MNKFVCLEATVSQQEGGMVEFQKQGQPLQNWRRYGTPTSARKQSLITPVPMYRCETWKMNKGDEKRINVFQNNILRRILKIKWQDEIRIQEILRLSKMRPLSQEMKYRRWKFIAHILWKDHNNNCNITLSWTPEGRRKRGRPKILWRKIVENEREVS